MVSCVDLYDLNKHLYAFFFLFSVGLDIQQKFTVFYLGPKRFGNQILMQKKPETEMSHFKHSIAVPSKGK